MSSPSVLFTSVGRRVELLRAFRSGYADLGLESAIVAVDIDPLAPALREADSAYLVPRLTDPDYIPVLASICKEHEVKIIFPLIDPDVPVLSMHRDLLTDTGTKVAVVPMRSAEIVGDKWLTHELFRQLNVPTPETWLPRELPPKPTFPLLVKPRQGSAGNQVFRIDTERELDFFVEYVADSVVQEFLTGPEITNDVFCDLTGRVISVASRKRLEVRSGEVSKGQLIVDRDTAAQCKKIASALNAIGPITIQGFERAGITLFTEVNARFGGGVPFSIAAGHNFPKQVLMQAAGLEVTEQSVPSTNDLFMTRYDQTLILRNEDLDVEKRNLRP